MWRGFFLGVGIFLMVLGLECLAVEEVTLKLREPPPATTPPFEQPKQHGPPRKFNPPPWAPWSLLSSGAVVCLYSFTIPTRFKK